MESTNQNKQNPCKQGRQHLTFPNSIILHGTSADNCIEDGDIAWGDPTVTGLPTWTPQEF